MNKRTVTKYLNLFGIPVLTAVIGLIVLLNPDSAAAVITKIIGWLLIIGGAVRAISMAERNGQAGPLSWITTVFCIILGILILKNPLMLAKSIGRFLGILLVIRGGSDLKESRHRSARVLAIVTLIIGAALFMMPMTFTRTVMRLCGMVVTVLGVISIAEKIRQVRLLESGDRPNIIDADE